MPLTTEVQSTSNTRIVPHARTLRRAREQVRLMVADGFSIQKIRNYLEQWGAWWVRASQDWSMDELLKWFIDVCWSSSIAEIAMELRHRYAFKALKLTEDFPLVAIDH